MSLMDTTDGAFMSKAYSWAFASPIRKVFYNLTVTSLSVFVALFVGVVELAQIMIRILGLHGGVFDAVASFDFIGVAGVFFFGGFALGPGRAVVVFTGRPAAAHWA